MSEPTIAVPRSFLMQLQQALDTTVDTNVTVDGLCRIGVYSGGDDTRTCFNAIEACLKLQERLVCPASDGLDKLLAASAGGADGAMSG